MGAPHHYTPRAPRPQPVWILDLWIGATPARPPRAGILLDWRRVDTEGRPAHWEGLVVTTSGGGERGWQLEVGWRHAAELRPMEVAPPT